MEKLYTILILLFAFTFAQAQNATEAKMAYQMAEEKFDAERYDEALDFLKKAETGLGKAAEAGYLQGILETANLYFSGKGGITKNYTKAAKYYESYYKSEKKNEGYLDNLIEIYNRGGHGMEKDKEKAKYWKNITRK